MKFLTTLVMLAAAHAALADSTLLIKDAWVRQAPPGARMLAAYLTVENPSGQARTLTGVDSTHFDHVMLHKSETVDGIARMIHVDEMQLPAHGSLVLEPGGYHLMMPAPEQRLVTGDKVEFSLHFANGEVVTLQAEVRRP